MAITLPAENPSEKVTVAVTQNYLSSSSFEAVIEKLMNSGGEDGARTAARWTQRANDAGLSVYDNGCVVAV